MKPMPTMVPETTTTIRCHLHLVETILFIIKMTMVRLLTAMETKIFLVSMHQDQAETISTTRGTTTTTTMPLLRQTMPIMELETPTTITTTTMPRLRQTMPMPTMVPETTTTIRCHLHLVET